MKLPTRIPWRSSIGVLLVMVAVTAASSSAGGHEPPIEFDEADIFFEMNSTDEDAGIQVFLDGEGWETVKLYSPDGKKLLRFRADGGIGDVGITELFFESAEPSLDDLPLDELLAMFPEGEYRLSGRTVDGTRMAGTATLTHALPAGPELLTPAEDEVVDPDEVVVSWEPVTEPEGIEIVGYQVVVEQEDPLRVFSVDVPPDVTSVTVPAEFFEADQEYKFEVLAIEASDNKTISERPFQTE